MPETIIVNGYAYPDVDEAVLRQALPQLTFVSAFSYGVTPEGGLILLEDGRLTELAAPFGVRTLMVLTALDEHGMFHSENFGETFRQPGARERYVEAILANLRAKGMAGVDFDFEYIPAEARDLYTSIIAYTRERLNAEGYAVLAALAPKTSGDQQGVLYQGHDYEGVGRAANLVLLMTYEWGYTYGPPMAVAPINKVRQVLDYGVTVIDPAKILMGIPNYGYDWKLPFVKGESKARSIGNEEALEIAARYQADILFDETAQAPYFRYWDEAGAEHEVWFEDERSIRAKLALAAEYGLAGVSYWNLMRPFAANWRVLGEMYRIERW